MDLDLRFFRDEISPDTLDRFGNVCGEIFRGVNEQLSHAKFPRCKSRKKRRIGKPMRQRESQILRKPQSLAIAWRKNAATFADFFARRFFPASSLGSTAVFQRTKFAAFNGRFG